MTGAVPFDVLHANPVPLWVPEVPPDRTGELFTTLLTTLNGVTAPVLRLVMQEAAREFFNRTFAWREPVYGLAYGNRLRLRLADPRTLPLSILGVFRGDEMRALGPNSVVLSGEDVVLQGDYYNGDRLAVLLAIGPREAGARLPDRIFTEWYDALLYGMTYRLCNMPARPWSSPKQAAEYRIMFMQQCSRARIQVETQHAAGAQRWAYPVFASNHPINTRARDMGVPPDHHRYRNGGGFGQASIPPRGTVAWAKPPISSTP